LVRNVTWLQTRWRNYFLQLLIVRT
jgi:hypothetical protein